MQLRRFLGDNTPAALNAVREALGDDAIILANRRVGERVEIIATGQIDDEAIAVASAMEAGIAPAALDISNREAPKASDEDRQAASRAVHPSVSAGRGDEDDGGIHVQISTAAIERNAASGTTPPGAARDPADEGASQRHPAFRDIDSLSPKRSATDGDAGNQPVRMTPSAARRKDNALDAAQIGASTPASRAASNPTSTSESTAAREYGEFDEAIEPGESGESGGPGATSESGRAGEHSNQLPRSDSAAADADLQPLYALLEQHLAAQSALLEKRFQQQDTKLWGELDPTRSTNFKRLLRLGLGAELAAELVDTIPGELDLDAATRRALSQLKARLPIGTDNTLCEAGITVLTGPAGGGKSTVLMKLAAEYVRCHDRQSLVMVCADNRRIGAFESLQACARLLGVPAVHARSNAELADRIDALSHKALVLVDHTLASEPESLAITALPALDRGTRELRRLLVLPATLQAATAEAIISHRANVADHCVLTQLDKCARLGELFSALIRHQLPVAWWSDNAHIQHPMQKADASILVATAVAMGRRVPATHDDDLLMGLIQPSRDIAGTRVGQPITDTAAQEFSHEATKIARLAAISDSSGSDPVAGISNASKKTASVSTPETFSKELADIVETFSRQPVERSMDRQVTGSRIRSGHIVGKRKVGRDLT